MTPITTTEELEKFCALCRDAAYITVDTEFLREKTYYAKLCLLQIGAPDDGLAVAIDTLSPDLNLAPLESLFFNDRILKIFHAARQDLEIFVELFGRVPAPLFDTQVAAMVAGYGDQIGYQSLVRQICNVELDKSNQFTDWSRRPLTEDQITYALADVTWLRQVYLRLQSELERKGRQSWIDDEMAFLLDPETHRSDPDTVWRKVKIRSDKPRVLAALRALAAWREREAIARDRPRNFIIRDEVLAELAKQLPASEQDLALIRGIPERFREGKAARELLGLIKDALATPKDSWPKKDAGAILPPEQGSALEMLKMLLKIQAAEHGVVARLIADQAALETFLLTPDEHIKDMHFMHGWRFDVFGQYAKSLISGDIALTLKDGAIRRIATA